MSVNYGWIYLLESNNHNPPLKLGFTRNIEKRIQSLQRQQDELRLLFSIQGTISQEKRYHRHLRNTLRSCNKSEWYPLTCKNQILGLMLANYTPYKKKV
jgi:hypothetical protein